MFNPRLFTHFLPPVLYMAAACYYLPFASERVIAVIYLLQAISHLIGDMIQHNDYDHTDS